MDSWDEIDNIEDYLDKNIYFEDKKFKAPILAKDIIYQFHDFSDSKSGINRGYLITRDDKQIWRYNGGFYQQDGEEIIRNKIQKILQSGCKTHYKNEVVDWVKDDINLYIDRAFFDSLPNKLNFENGTYDVETKTFENHTPVDCLNYKIPIKYDTKAKMPQIKKFLEDILYLEDIPILQELLGYCLYRKYFLHKAFLFVGEGRNGKTTLLNLITAFLGENNIASVSLHSICRDKFSSYDLYGKLANLWDDLSSDIISNTGLFKIATGGGYIRAEKKFQDSFKFINKAKFIFSCNIIPESKDKSLAYAKRWIVIEFPNTFEGKDCNPMIIEKLTTDEELSGLLNWAIEGLHKLLEQMYFSEHRTLEDVIMFHAETQHPVFKFVEIYIDREAEGEITKEKVYEKFLMFCKETKYPTVASNVFSIKFKQYAPWGLDEGQSRMKGMKKTWKGIKFRENVKKSKEDEQQEKLI